MTKVLEGLGDTKPSHPVAFASTVALCLCAWASAASGEPALGVTRTQYVALQSISHEFGSKFTSGYFLSETGKCVVTLMVAEKNHSESPSSQTAARVRLMLNPGQMAGLDSEEGRSLNFTCAPEATALVVDVGDRNSLASQRHDLSRSADLNWSSEH